MGTQTATLTTRPAAPHRRRPRPEPLLREALGDALRAFRAEQRITLRELAESARVSPGYISELERGRKEVSSELLASVCHALGVTVADVLIEAAGSMALGDVAEELATGDLSEAAPREA
ncbi:MULTISPECIES: helix-turn-helix transcriptional regulator [unclassified Corynebacterium]|uniref:helix-turn-helix domain-containing protein n=1 Tax=unclassified Corynebacterium TaxID=2624378 RepID=UPI0029C9C1D5|nr:MULTISPECIES: helix-turn-helix transcriptional regulator [unclassified Corynebacterium]WPF65272.1 helix-turn-helix transcriptional regulator [Corynebacterium sp. 22KM0430]WPF67767.1 helix-turn-helix transcriptional regulator [Corynebacterium sp. 21KM1197]